MTSEIIAQAFLICQDESRQLLVPFLYWCRCYNPRRRLSPNWSALYGVGPLARHQRRPSFLSGSPYVSSSKSPDLGTDSEVQASLDCRSS